MGSEMKCIGSLRIEREGGILYRCNANMLELTREETEFVKGIIGKVLNEEDKEKLQLQRFQTLLDRMIEGGFLTFEHGINETSRIIKNEIIMSEYGLSAPVTVHIYPTYACNQKCFFCYNPDSKDSRIMINSKYKENIFKLLDELYEAGVIIINFLGGEPLLYFEELIEFFDYCKDKFFVSFATNASARGGITESKARILSKYRNMDIRVSLEAVSTELHDEIVGCKGSFEVVEKSISNIKKYHLPARISCLPTKKNMHEIEKLVLYAKENDLCGFHLLNPHSTVNYNMASKEWLNSKEKREIIEELKCMRNQYESNTFEISFSNWEERLKGDDQMCSGAGQMLEICPNGDAYPCSMVLENKSFFLGNVFKEGYQAVWEENLNSKKLSRRIEMIQSERCIKCKKVRKCLGGCPLENYINQNSIYIPVEDEICFEAFES